MEKNLIVLLGPTGIGKTDLSIELAEKFDAAIVSSDSRQFYRQMRIGTAVPDKKQLARVEHHFIQCMDITEPYTCGRYENDALELLGRLFMKRKFVILTGGSGLYIDAVCRGIDAVPGTDPILRSELTELYRTEGLDRLLEMLREKDPSYYETADRNNPKRILRALEVCIGTGRSYSDLRTGTAKQRDFNIIYTGLTMPREQLYERIDRRVDAMMREGLENEAKELYPLRHLNALQTVGYKELFDYMEGRTSLEKAVELIKRNTRRYAKRQITWFARNKNIRWFVPDKKQELIDYITTESSASV